MSRLFYVSLVVFLLCLYLTPSLALEEEGAELEEMEQVEPMVSLMEVGAESTISSQAAKPLQDVARLLVEAKNSINRLNRSRDRYNVVSHSIQIRKNTVLAPVPTPKKAEKINAQLVPHMEQPHIHDSKLWGTKYPVQQDGKPYITASIVGEDGKPYIPRKQWKGITDDPAKFRSPFAKYVFYPKVGSSADVANVDPNTKLTPVELKSINSIQLRLKKLLDKLGSNYVWDYSSVRNRKLITDFDDLKVEARTLLEEYEIRTGVKTIAWQLNEPDPVGLFEPNGQVTDIHFANSPELAGRVLQRGRQTGPPAPSRQEAAATAKAVADAAAAVAPPKPKEQRVNVRWKKGADGLVRTKVNLAVVDSKVPIPGAPPNLNARKHLKGKRYKSGKIGRSSSAVQIDVVAPTDEQLSRNKEYAKKASSSESPAAQDVAVTDAPKINL